jgi:hypothetical protein
MFSSLARVKFILVYFSSLAKGEVYFGKFFLHLLKVKFILVYISSLAQGEV